jgi:hypothetical protein
MILFFNLICRKSKDRNSKSRGMSISPIREISKNVSQLVSRVGTRAGTRAATRGGNSIDPNFSAPIKQNYSPPNYSISHRFPDSKSVLCSTYNTINYLKMTPNKKLAHKVKPTPYQQKEEERKKMQNLLLSNQSRFKTLNLQDFLSTCSLDHLNYSNREPQGNDTFRNLIRSGATINNNNMNLNIHGTNFNNSIITNGTSSKKVTVYSVKSLHSISGILKQEGDKRVTYPVLEMNSTGELRKVSSVSKNLTHLRAHSSTKSTKN